MKTEHALDWGKSAQEIEDQFQAGMIERDRYKRALERIEEHWDGDDGEIDPVFMAHVAKDALLGLG